jgi:hypothetical protein
MSFDPAHSPFPYIYRIRLKNSDEPVIHGAFFNVTLGNTANAVQVEDEDFVPLNQVDGFLVLNTGMVAWDQIANIHVSYNIKWEKNRPVKLPRG